jgi:hypothetical protein
MIIASVLALLSGLVAPPLSVDAAPSAPDSAIVVPKGDPHDFDFEFGAWTVHIRRLLHPLTGSTSWVDMAGSSVVRRVWQGRANLGELEVAGGGVRLEGMSLRVYDPVARHWNIHWTNANDGLVGAPMQGGFAGGRGLFYDHEQLGERTIAVRFIFSDITATTFRLEQAFSPDEGRTWEPNWIATFRRVPAAKGHRR